MEGTWTSATDAHIQLKLSEPVVGKVRLRIRFSLPGTRCPWAAGRRRRIEFFDMPRWHSSLKRRPGGRSQVVRITANGEPIFVGDVEPWKLIEAEQLFYVSPETSVLFLRARCQYTVNQKAAWYRGRYTESRSVFVFRPVRASSLTMTDGKAFGEASYALTRLADGLRQDGNTIGADFLIDTAARVELLSDELQNCWGGPFNGQTGRQRVALEILDKVRPDAVIETGTFRGITTEWFANHFAGPIFSCEVERMYLIQAQHRLDGFGHVSLFPGRFSRFLA